MIYRNKKLLEAVRDASCMLCGAETEGVAAAHSNQLKHGKGFGQKAHDCYIAALCPSCHHAIDQGKAMSKEERATAWQTAFEKTLLWLWTEERIKIV